MTTQLTDHPKVIYQNLRLLDYVTVLPNSVISNDLAFFRLATLEVLQNRAESTVYRIRQTGLVYHMFRHEVVIIHRDMADFYKEIQDDDLIAEYAHKSLVYILDGERIRRIKPPRFNALFDDRWHLHTVQWVDPKPNLLSCRQKIRNGMEFLKAHLYDN